MSRSWTSAKPETQTSRSAYSDSQRYSFLDAARGIAIVLAMSAHAIDQFTSFYLWHLRPLTRVATPTFLIIFGVIVSVVYLRKARQSDDLGGLQSGLFARMLTCYVGCAAITWAGYFGDKTPLSQVGEAMLMMDRGRYAFILFLYTILLGLIAVSLPLLKRWGILVFVVASAAAWSLHALVPDTEAFGSDTLQMLIGHRAGYGPAVLLSLSVVTVGVLLGEALQRRAHWGWVALVALSAAAAVGNTAIQDWGRTFIDGIASDYRFQNHIAYFAYGCLGALLIIAFAAMLGRWAGRSLLFRCLTVWGRRTLFIYAAGNILLNLLPLHDVRFAVTLIQIALFLALILGAALDLDREDSLIDQAAGGFFTRFKLRWNGATARIASVVWRRGGAAGRSVPAGAKDGGRGS